MGAGERVRYHARWVVPISTPPIEHGTLVVQDDRIVWVGPSAQAPAGGRDEPLGDAIITPGLVNAHTHLDLTAMRGFLEDLPFFEWVRILTQARAAVFDPRDELDSAMAGIAEGLRAGITTYGDTTDSDAGFDAMRAMGVRGIAYREVFGPDPAVAVASLDGLREKVNAMRARGAADTIVRVGVSPHAPYSVSDALFAAVASYAAAERLPVAVHIAESADEHALVTAGRGPFADFLLGRGIHVQVRGTGEIALLRAAGLMRAGTLLIHCVRATTADARSIANTGCGVAHCPASNAKLGHGIAPLAGLLAAGARVGLGSDSMASNNQMDMLTEGRLAVLQQRALAGRGDVLSARAALRLATLGGAEALRLDAEVGSLEVGKQADLAAFSIDPIYGDVNDPAAALIFASHCVRVERVMVAGVERMRNGVVTGLDESLPARIGAISRRLMKWREARAGR